MATTARGIINPCKNYFIHLDSKDRPILGTMFSKNNSAKIDHGYNCREALLPTTQMKVPAGHVQCFAKNHLRYFYKVSKVTGRVLPNSFFEHIGKPTNMCSGTFSILEYLMWI